MRARDTGRRYTHPSDTLPTPLLTQRGKTPLELASTDEVKAELAVITDDNKNALLLDCARLGLVSRLRAVLQAGANAALINQVRVRARFRGSGSWVSVYLCPHVFIYRAIHDIRVHALHLH